VFPFKHGDIPASYVIVYQRVVFRLVFRLMGWMMGFLPEILQGFSCGMMRGRHPEEESPDSEVSNKTHQLKNEP